jgi:hypothetical protein
MMNERIKDLYIQALCEYEDANGVFIPPDFVEKFAELIVRECSRISKVNQAEDMGWDIGEILQEHFGVESEIERCPRCNEEWSGTSCGISDCGWITGVEE